MENLVASQKTCSPDAYLDAMVLDTSLRISDSTWGVLCPLISTFSACELQSSKFVLGKLPNCDYVILEDMFPNTQIIRYISNRHFEICTIPDKLPLIRDLSTSGTFINGALIGNGNVKYLNNDDTISVGKRDLKIFIYKSLENTYNGFLSEELQKKYQIISKHLGSGGYGEVKMVLDKVTFRPYAVKKIKKNSHYSASREINILQKLKHTHIISYIESDETSDEIFIVMEYMDRRDLNELLKEGDLTEPHIKYIFLQILMAVDYLHRMRIIHRDLKPENILQKTGVEDIIVKIGDFGLGKILDAESIANTCCGTRAYMAPEILLGNVYNYKVDVWSMGMLLYYMISSEFPFKLDFGDISSGNYPKVPYLNKVSKECNILIEKMLKIDPEERINVQNILENSWLSEDEDALKKVKRILDDNMDC